MMAALSFYVGIGKYEMFGGKLNLMQIYYFFLKDELVSVNWFILVSLDSYKATEWPQIYLFWMKYIYTYIFLEICLLGM